MILVTGATGKVGRHLVAELLAAGVPVRALTRDPGSARLPAGAQLACLDAADPATLDAALDGVTAVFVNVSAVGAIIGPLMRSAATAGAGRAVMLSSFTVRDDGDQEYALGTQHKAIEDVVTAAGLAWTILRCGGFAANTLAWASSIRQEGVVRAPYGQAATAVIGERDVAAAAASVLLGAGHDRARYVLTGGESLTQIEQVQVIGAAIGRNLRFEEVPPEVFRAAAAAQLPAAAIEDVLRYRARYTGRPAEIWPDLEKLTGRPAASFADWVHEHVASFR